MPRAIKSLPTCVIEAGLTRSAVANSVRVIGPRDPSNPSTDAGSKSVGLDPEAVLFIDNSFVRI
jgi:hypothetical protein